MIFKDKELVHIIAVPSSFFVVFSGSPCSANPSEKRVCLGKILPQEQSRTFYGW